jgi:hypothetical protein
MLSLQKKMRHIIHYLRGWAQYLSGNIKLKGIG